MRRYKYHKHYEWTSGIAYLAGLIAADGCLVNNGRHIVMISKDLEVIQNTQNILNIHTKFSLKAGQFNTQAYHFQFSDVALYDFLMSSGITPAKSKTIQKVTLPDEYYGDFLRGYFDGDGTVWGYKDKRWKNSYMYYCGFVSASLDFLCWLQQENRLLAGVSEGRIKKSTRAFTLNYAKQDSQRLFAYMYSNSKSPRLSRKYDAFRGFISTDPYAKITVDARVL